MECGSSEFFLGSLFFSFSNIYRFLFSLNLDQVISTVSYLASSKLTHTCHVHRFLFLRLILFLVTWFLLLCWLLSALFLRTFPPFPPLKKKNKKIIKQVKSEVLLLRWRDHNYVVLEDTQQLPMSQKQREPQVVREDVTQDIVLILPLHERVWWISHMEWQ